MKVKAIWEFEFDDTDLDPAQVDIHGLAKDTAKCELMHMLRKRELIADDFEYVTGENESVKQEDADLTSYWERKVYKHLWSTNVRVQYKCHRCRGVCERVYSHDIIDIDMWNGYMAENWKPKNGLPQFCSGCGSKMDLDKTNHDNWVVID